MKKVFFEIKSDIIAHDLEDIIKRTGMTQTESICQAIKLYRVKLLADQLVDFDDANGDKVMIKHSSVQSIGFSGDIMRFNIKGGSDFIEVPKTEKNLALFNEYFV